MVVVGGIIVGIGVACPIRFCVIVSYIVLVGVVVMVVVFGGVVALWGSSGCGSIS